MTLKDTIQLFSNWRIKNCICFFLVFILQRWLIHFFTPRPITVAVLSYQKLVGLVSFLQQVSLSISGLLSSTLPSLTPSSAPMYQPKALLQEPRHLTLLHHLNQLHSSHHQAVSLASSKAGRRRQVIGDCRQMAKGGILSYLCYYPHTLRDLMYLETHAKKTNLK